MDDNTRNQLVAVLVDHLAAAQKLAAMLASGSSAAPSSPSTPAGRPQPAQPGPHR